MVKFGTDDEAVAIANDCPFGLGSSVFSGSRRRARAIAARLEVGWFERGVGCVWVSRRRARAIAARLEVGGQRAVCA